MSDEEEFDSEKTQFWLPGQALPGRPAAGEADGDHESVNLKQPPQGAQRQAGSATDAAAAGSGTIDFDLTAEQQPGSGELDFDLSGEGDTGTMDFDITGEGTAPPKPDAKPAPEPDAKSAPKPEAKPAPTTSTPGSSAKAARAPAPPASDSGSGGAVLFVAVVAIVAAVIYFMTR